MDHRHIDDGGTKQHAQRRDQPARAHPYWVYDDQDWEEMRQLPSGYLICPEPGCPVEYQVPRSNDKGTRWLARRASSRNCTHHTSRPAGHGGPVSAKHRWIQARTVRILQTLGIDAIPEHASTNSDVYVPAANLSIEIQHWDTNFRRRTAARLAKGATQVLWLLPEPDFADSELRAGSKSADNLGRALFSYPAARLRVHHVSDKNRRLRPWEDRQQNSAARISVYGTVTWLDRADDGLALNTGLRSVRAFLDEIIDARRVWCPPGTAGLPRKGGAWVLRDDLAAVAEFRRRQHERQVTQQQSLVEPRPTLVTPPKPTAPVPEQRPTPNALAGRPPARPNTEPPPSKHPKPHHHTRNVTAATPARTPWWLEFWKWLLGE